MGSFRLISSFRNDYFGSASFRLWVEGNVGYRGPKERLLEYRTTGCATKNDHGWRGFIWL